MGWDPKKENPGGFGRKGMGEIESLPEKAIHDLKLNESIAVELVRFGTGWRREVDVLRVPGGWIYSILWWKNSDPVSVSSAFVPLNSEFKIMPIKYPE